MTGHHQPAPATTAPAGNPQSWRVTRCDEHRGWADDPTGDCPDPCPDCTYQPVYTLDVPMTVRLRTGRTRPLTHNDRLHWRPRSQKVRQIRQAVGLLARSRLIPQCDHITVTLHYRTGDGRSVTDAPNLTATSKPAIDGLVDARVVPDDTDRHVTEHMPVVHRGTGERRLWLEIALTEESHRCPDC